MTLSELRSEGLSIAVASLLLGGYLTYRGISLWWLVPFLLMIATLAVIASFLRKRVRSGLGRRGVHVAFSALSFASAWIMFDLIVLREVSPANWAGAVIGALIFGGLRWSGYKGDHLSESTPGSHTNPPSPSETEGNAGSETAKE